MPNQKKSQTIDKLQEKLSKAKSLVFVDYSHLSVPQQQELRNKIKETGGEFTVAKNTLFKLALKTIAGLPREFVKAEFLRGPTATLFSFKDEIAPIKALVEFSEEFEVPKVKMGFFEGKLIEKEEILALAKIPSRDELLAKLVYLLNSPLSGLVSVLSADMRKLVFILTHIKKEGGEN